MYQIQIERDDGRDIDEAEARDVLALAGFKYEEPVDGNVMVATLPQCIETLFIASDYFELTYRYKDNEYTVSAEMP